jgi:hypothetical protein
MYTRVTYFFPDGIEVHEYHTARYGAPGQKREKRKKPTPEAVKKNNLRQREQRIRHQLRMNFTENDYWIRLSYKKDERPPNLQAAEKEMANFRKRLKRRFDKAGVPLKWIQKTEVGTRGAIHHHMVLPRIPDLDLILKDCWPGGLNIGLTYQTGDFAKLAEYIAKEEGKVSKVTASRNLLKPKVKKQKMAGKTIDKEPKQRKNYELDKDSMVRGLNPWGYPYRIYTMHRIRGDDDQHLHRSKKRRQ